MSDLIDTTEMYLRTIFELEEEGIVPMRARIAERIGHSGPTVSQTVARMERDGLLHVSGDRHLELTDSGRLKATRVMRKHRLAERLLLDVIGLDWELVHDEACRWEHVMSEQVERKLLGLLSGPFESPYGNPIPGLDELGGAGAEGSGAVRPLTDMVDGVVGIASGAGVGADGPEPGLPLVVRRLGETLQSDHALLARLLAVDCRPGRRVAAHRSGRAIRVRTGLGDLELSPAAAQYVFVEAVG